MADFPTRLLTLGYIPQAPPKYGRRGHGIVVHVFLSSTRFADLFQVRDGNGASLCLLPQLILGIVRRETHPPIGRSYCSTPSRNSPALPPEPISRQQIPLPPHLE